MTATMLEKIKARAALNTKDEVARSVGLTAQQLTQWSRGFLHLFEEQVEAIGLRLYFSRSELGMT